MLVILSLFSFNVAWANHTVCKSGATERSVEVASTNAETGVPCEVKYTKDGETSVLWSAQNDAAYCQTKAAGLVEKLSTAGWNCVTDGHASTVEAKTAAPVKKQAPATAKPAEQTHKKVEKKDKKQCADKNCTKDKPCKKCAEKCSDCKKDKMQKDVKATVEKADAKSEREAKKAKKKAEREAKKAKKQAEREAKKAKAQMDKEAKK
ncbi:MAG: hypothetical protein R3A45_08720 [Bdellovibrionota bacterium]